MTTLQTKLSLYLQPISITISLSQTLIMSNRFFLVEGLQIRQFTVILSLKAKWSRRQNRQLIYHPNRPSTRRDAIVFILDYLCQRRTVHTYKGLAFNLYQHRNTQNQYHFSSSRHTYLHIYSACMHKGYIRYQNNNNKSCCDC